LARPPERSELPVWSGQSCPLPLTLFLTLLAPLPAEQATHPANNSLQFPRINRTSPRSKL
jgi:hypothetical protein